MKGRGDAERDGVKKRREKRLEKNVRLAPPPPKKKTK